MPLLMINLHRDWFPQGSAFADDDSFCEPYSYMEFDIHAVFSAVLVCSVFILLFVLITKSKTVVSKIPMWIWAAFVFLIGIRLMFPPEYCYISHSINSAHIMCIFDDVVNYELICINSFGVTVGMAFCVIWMAVAAVLLIYYCVKYFKFFSMTVKIPQTDNERILNALERVKKNNNFKSSPKIIENESVDFPFEFGLFRQCVFINKTDYTDDELYYILLHEMTHFQNKSNVINVFAAILKIVFWWNPVIWLFKNHIEYLLEIYADKGVTKKLTDKEKADYMKCVYNVFVNIGAPLNSAYKMGIPMAKPAAENTLFDRLKIITKNNKINVPVSFLAAAIFLLFILVSDTLIIQPYYKPPTSELNITFDDDGLNSEDTYIIIENGEYVLYYNGERLLKTSDKSTLPNVPIKNSEVIK